MTEEARVLTWIVENYWRGYWVEPTEITEAFGFPHGQRAGGILRYLGNRGLIDRDGLTVYPTEAGCTAVAIFTEDPAPTTQEDT